MSGGWRIIAAVGVAAFAAFILAILIFVEANNSQRIYEHQAAKAAEQYRDTARVHAERSCANIASPEAFECIHEQYHAAWQREREQYDFQAQLVTSAWTRAMGLAAAVAMFFGIVGVGLVYATFDATKEGNRITRETADIELRPWLEISVDGKRYILNEKQATVTYFLTIKNIGKTPATIVYPESALFNFEAEQEIAIPAFFESEFKPHPGSRPRAILPQGELEIRHSAHMPRDAVKITETAGGAGFVIPMLAVRVLYKWSETGLGKTAIAYQVSRPRANPNQAWMPIEVFPDAETRQTIAMHDSRFDSIT
jgi:hypothetical protein